MSSFILENVAKTFFHGEVPVYALSGINLKAESGDFIAIMGPSGSGKTTLLNILGCLDTPTSGKYILNQRDVSTLKDDELSEVRNTFIGFVFQQFYLLPYATVMDNILLPTLYRHSPIQHREKKIDHILRIVGLEGRMTFRPNQLSGGQQQRVAIARALINDPELILCDEPTGQLDGNTARGIMEVLNNLNNNGKTIVLITHDHEIAGYADKIYHIQDGRFQI